MNKIIIAGGTGFLGKALEHFYIKKGYSVVILTRNPKQSNHVFWDGESLGNWVEELENSKILINLAGKSVDCRYTKRNKTLIYDSRMKSTSILGEALALIHHPPSIWVNASSATIYQHSEENLMKESNGIIGDDFSMNICKSWENTFFANKLPENRKIAIRTSIVLGAQGGAILKLRPIVKMGLGGHQGNGNQKISWIHINDFCRAIDFIIQETNLEGAINITAPNPISNKNFMKILRELINVSIGIPQPKFLLEIGTWLLRSETELVLKSRNVYPEKLLEAGFKFKFTDVKSALTDILIKKSDRMKLSYTK